RVTPAPVALSISPDRVSAGDSTSGFVTIDKPAPIGGTLVMLSTSDPSSCFIPDSVTVPEGAASTTFPIGTSANVNGATTATVTATVGPDSSTASLTIIPFVAAVLLQSQLFPYPFLPTHAEVGGSVVWGAVVLSDPAREPDG